MAYNDSQTLKKPDSSPYGSVFAGTGGQMVVCDLTLDENRYDYPYSVKSGPFRYTVGSGIGIRYGWYGLRFAHVYGSRTIKGQRNGQACGTLHLFKRYGGGIHMAR